MAAVFVLALLSSVAAWFVYAQGYTLYYGDAEAHLNIARRIFDSRTSGYDQIGTVWLPLPHVLTLPFIGEDSLWRSGLAGAIPGVLCFIAGGAFLFGSVRLSLRSRAAAWVALLLYGLNPNLLYLQSTPMTEPVFLAALLGMLYFAVRFAATQALWCSAAAGLLSLAAALSRYDGWMLLPVMAIYILWKAGQNRVSATFIYCAIAGIGPLYWFGHNWWHYGNVLEFYNGQYSAKAIYGRALDSGMDRYPGDHEWRNAWLYFRSAAQLCAGAPLAWLGAAGIAAALWKRAFWPVLLLGAVPAFYVLSLYSSGTPIFVPHLWPNSYYNTRYGLAAFPLLVFCAAAIVATVPARFAKFAGIAVVFAVTLPWAANPSPASWITWKESEVNSITRRQWTREAADYLRRAYRPGDGIWYSFGDLTGILREAGIPLREGLHEGNNPQFDATLARPDLMLREEWALAISGDPVASALLKLWRTETPYERVKMVAVKGGPVIEIYRRSRRIPHHGDPIHEGARR